jgi:ABC-type uncharacterized transport system substrate-binding protein
MQEILAKGIPNASRFDELMPGTEGYRRIHEPTSEMESGSLAAGFAVLIFAVGAQAQQSTKVPRIGYLAASVIAAESRAAIGEGLRKVGYTDGQNIKIEYRYAEGKFERLPILAAELVRLKVDAILTAGSTATRAAKEATSTIPIVMIQDNDPVASGFVASSPARAGTLPDYRLFDLRPVENDWSY